MKTYPTIAAFLASIGRPFTQEFDCTVHRFEELHGAARMTSPSFRTDYFAFLLIETGVGEYTIDGQTFPLGPGDFYFTNPGHVKSFRVEEAIRGYILTFTDVYLQSHYVGRLPEEFPFLYDATVPVMRLAGNDFVGIERSFGELLVTYDELHTYRARLLAHQLLSLLYRTKALLLEYTERIGPESRAQELAFAFRRALNERFAAVAGARVMVPRVRELADDLAITPAYLSEVVRAATGHPPKYWIDDRLLAEARSLLLNDPAPIAEIADRLGYEDASNFSRFFKHHMGQSPRQFRIKDGKPAPPKY